MWGRRRDQERDANAKGGHIYLALSASIIQKPIRPRIPPGPDRDLAGNGGFFPCDSACRSRRHGWAGLGRGRVGVHGRSGRGRRREARSEWEEAAWRVLAVALHPVALSCRSRRKRKPAKIKKDEDRRDHSSIAWGIRRPAFNSRLSNRDRPRHAGVRPQQPFGAARPKTGLRPPSTASMSPAASF